MDNVRAFHLSKKKNSNNFTTEIALAHTACMIVKKNYTSKRPDWHDLQKMRRWKRNKNKKLIVDVCIAYLRIKMIRRPRPIYNCLYPCGVDGGRYAGTKGETVNIRHKRT